jgi:hypothetical protein
MQAMYHEKWYQVGRDAISYHTTNTCTWHGGSPYDSTRLSSCKHGWTTGSCNQCIIDLEKSVMNHLVSNSGGDLRFLRDLSTVFTPSIPCPYNQSYYSDWYTSIQRDIENIPKFEVGRPRYVV